MKRILTAAVLIVLLVLSLTACGGKDTGKTADDPNMIIIGDYQALYKGCEIMQDYDGDGFI